MPDHHDRAAPNVSVRSAAAWAVAGQYLAFGIQFVSSVVVSRYFLAPAEVGLFSIALAAALMLAVFQDFGLTRYVTALPVLDHDEIKRCSSVAMIFSWATAAALTLAAPLLAMLYHDPPLAPILMTIAVSYLFSPFSIVPYAILSREMAFNRIFAVNVASAAIQAATVIGLAAAGYSSMALALGMVAASVTRTITTQTFRPSLPFPPQWSGLSSILRFGWQSSCLSVIGAAGSRSADLIIGKLLSLTVTGIYSRSTGLSGQLRTLVTGAVGTVLYPAFARLKRQGDPLAEPYLHIIACFTAATWPVMAGLAVGAEPLVQSLFGPRWIAVAPVLKLLAVGEMLLETVPMQIDIPILYGAIRRLIVRNMLDTVASIVLLVIGASYSVEAAAASRIAYGAVWFLIYISFICGLIGLPLARLIPVYAKALVTTLASVTPLAIASVVMPDFAHCGMITLGALALVGGGVWVVVLRLLNHPLYHEIADVGIKMTRQFSRQRA